MEDENKGSEMAGAKESAGADQKETKTTLIDLLKDPEYQKQFDILNGKSLETAKTKWKEESEKEKTEAEKLAGMKAEEKLQYRLDEEKKKREESEKKLNARDLKDEAIKIATSKDTEFDVGFLGLIDFENMTADKLNETCKSIKGIQDKLIERAINNYSKEDSPKNVNPDGGAVKKTVPKIF